MEVNKVLCALIFFSANICLHHARETISVNLKQGELSGTIEKTIFQKKDYYAFKGIPFAQPPIGTLRFKPPVPHAGWKNVYKAYKNKPTCFQFSSRLRKNVEFGMSGSEDCLYISVFTPDLKASAPVVVFEYNDNFKSSFNGSDAYSPDFFLEENTIVVTISHRLNVLGYLTTEDSIIPPNAGLKDFIMGLKWVKDNIEQFGGDPNRITLMGNRGGAIMAEILLRSKEAANLLNSVIIQSGTAMETEFFSENPRSKAFELGQKLNISSDNSELLLEALQQLDIKTVYSKLGEVVFQDGETFFTFSPTVENDYPGAVITSLPEHGKIVNDVPVMIGMNSREGLDLISQYLFHPQIVNELENEFLFLIPIRTNFQFDKKSNIYKNATQEIIDFYFKEGRVYFGNILQYSVYIGDILQNYALNLAVKNLNKNMKSPVYYYMFDFRGHLNENSDFLAKNTPLPLEPWGATITDELCYLHVCTNIKEKYKYLSKLVSEQPEIKVLKKMVRLWTNFAKTGNPTPTKQDDILKDFSWKPINKDGIDTDYVHITKFLKMKVNPLSKRDSFWDEFLSKYAELAVDGIVGDNETDKKHDEL